MSPEPDPFAALGDANRRSIVRELVAGEKSVQEIADRLPISRPAVSRHLRLLKEAGLVSHRPDGVRRLYRLEDAGASEVREFMQQVWGEAMVKYRMVVENTSSN